MNCSPARGFSLLELLVVMAIITLLASLTLPALSKARAQAQKAKCLSNQRQLVLTWLLYAPDNGDHLVSNGSTEANGLGLDGPLWVPGGNHFTQFPFTNRAALTDPSLSLFAHYLPAVEVYKCPPDRSHLNNDEKFPLKIRSYAMNAYLGTTASFATFDDLTPGAKLIRKTTDFTLLSPSATFVTQDVNPPNLCFAAFVVRLGKTNGDNFFHYPSGLHSRSGVLSFGDGHAAARRWQDARTLKKVPDAMILGHWETSYGNRDQVWLQEHTTVER